MKLIVLCCVKTCFQGREFTTLLYKRNLPNKISGFKVSSKVVLKVLTIFSIDCNIQQNVGINFWTHVQWHAWVSNVVAFKIASYKLKHVCLT